MPFNINTFKSNFTNGGARPTDFDVTFTSPVGTSTLVQFMAQAASIPPMIVSAIEIPYFGRKIKVGGNRTYPEWTIRIMNDENFQVRTMFEAWSQLLNTPEGNLRTPDTDASYKVNMTLTQYGQDGSSIRVYSLIGAFPTTIDPIQLDWNNQNTIEEFNVSIAYDYWQTTGGSATDPITE